MSIYLVLLCTWVAWLGQVEKLTWEPSSSLPEGLINDFHKGLSSNELVSTSINYGAISHTLVMGSESMSQKEKKTKEEENTNMFNSG